MFNVDDESADEVISLLDQIKISDITSDKLFRAEVIGQMNNVFSARPWMMCLALYIFRGIYVAMQYVASKNGCLDPVRRSIMNERLKNIQFASQFGRLANAAGRAWFFEHIRLSKINKIDAVFLTWSGVIQIRRRKICLSRWDSISGYFLMAPLIMLLIIPSLVSLCDGISTLNKALQVTGYLALICFLFKLYKSMSFDVYKVASKYYVTNSWFGEPSLR